MNGYGEVRPLPRWTPLPDDPPALRRWLAEQSGDAAPDDDWPQDEPR